MGDTIAAIATPQGEGGIGIVRISGDDSLNIMKKILRPCPAEVNPRYAYYGNIVNPENENIIDEAICLYMKAPHSYTCEDVVEIQAHGGIVSIRLILRTVLECGARMAEPGEFTKLAFLNGRMDLAQAEAVIDVIKAKSEMPLQIAERQLKGRLGTEISEIRESLRDVLAQMAVNIDFPDEDIEQVESQRFCEDLSKVKEKVQNLLDTCDNGRIAKEGIRVAIVGKPNVGKSSLVNKLLGENRVIVSDIAGTTRDAIDTKITWQDRDYIFIDTAGLRRKSKVKEELERYSVIRTVTAVERADVVLVLIDAQEGITEQDAKIAGIAHERGKGVIVAVNKWDAVEKDDKTIYKYTNKIREVLSFMPYAEILFISAKTGLRISRMFEAIDMVIENQTLRIQTGVLNEILTEAVAMQQPPSDKGKRLKIFYMTQVAVKPPTFVIFVNSKELMHFSYTRYLENKIRDAFGFRGTSLKFIVRERKEKE